MEALNIKLNFNPQHFWEVYYPNGQSSLFKNRNARKLIFKTLIFALLSIVIYCLSFRFPKISWLIVLALLFTAFFTLLTIFAAIDFFKRKNSIKSFMKDFSQYSSFYLSITDNAFEFGMDSKITIDKWSSIKSVEMAENYLLLFNEAGPLNIFPAKSMGLDEFNLLKEFIKAKVK